MIVNCLVRLQKITALIFLTSIYSQTVLAAYKTFVTNEFVPVIYSPAGTNNYSSVVNHSSYSPSPTFKPILSTRKNEIEKNNTSGKNVGGPTQPEMTSFKSVGSGNMVDLFSGDFSYNIPLLDVGGYPVNLFYRSGITMDQEASWVGLGWNINPGTITRNLRGIPDDFDGKNDYVQKTTSIKVNKTIGGDIGGDVEIVGSPINVGANVGAFYNTYRGWGVETGLNASITAGFASMGTLSGGLSATNNSQDGLTISPSLSVLIGKQLTNDNAPLMAGVSIGGGFSYNSRSGLVNNLSSGLNLYQEVKKNNDSKTDDSKNDDEKRGNSLGLYSSSISFASPTYNPSAEIPFTNSQFTFAGKLGGEAFGVHGSIYLKGYVTKQYIASEDVQRTYPAYGYLYYQDANDNPQALLDFNREKDITYRDKPEVPNIAVPSYTYDLFCITGEGTGGTFRAYRGDIGFVHDPYVTTRDHSDAASIDLGFGNLFHGGVDFNVNRANTTTGSWVANNPLANTVKFKNNDSVFEAAYLRNPGEKSINESGFYKNIGDDDVVTAQLYQGSNGPLITSTNYLQHWKNKAATNVSTLLNSATDFKTKRDKRSQVISYLNAGEAARLGLDTLIFNYNMNQWAPSGCNATVVKTESRINSFRQSNHMSEVDVLNTDGRRYVYGLPVYNLFQEQVTFAADSLNNNKKTGLVKYNSTDASASNHHGKDNYFQKEVTSPYAHSFLLTSILSPDYVDVTGNGISDDDLGDAIKFNYTKVAGKDSSFGWRTPYVKDSATYNEGLQSYVRDDKGSYIYGEKEMWYLNSIESKNMVAIFILQKRSDLRSITETGIATDTLKSKCLKEIDLYSKSDYIQNGSNARPIKTIHFAYAYDLCKGINGNVAQGKLTLKKVWFTYNGNNKGVKNPYLFFYNTANPNYTNTAYDRWGNYKHPLQNPRSTTSDIITNAEYTYALQDSNLANINAAAWTMDSVVLPSSGSIKVGYESDDYAYVQNKRAMQMFNVVGLSYTAPMSFYSGNSGNNISNVLYNQQYSDNPDNLYVAIRVSNAVFSAKETFQKYLDGFSKIYFKLNVQMPTDQWGGGYEYIPVYADLDINTQADSSHYGILSGHNDIIWLKLKGINLTGDGDGSYSSLVKAATQFLRLNLPSKAYPGYETSDDIDLGDAVKMIGILGSNIVNAFSSFDNAARTNGWAVKIDTSRTYARLNNPIYKKYGGGIRVKFIKVYDNWKNMTGSNQSVYGQTYDYTTIKNINGVDTRISSGVATWEPMMGGEENPFRIPLEYIEKVAPLAPVTMGYSELPLGETFFPAPSIGYSQVRVHSLHSTNIKSATGYEETKFYTSYDFPIITDNSLFTPDTKKRYKTSLTDYLRLSSYHYLSMSQGFKIELNDMNGKIKSQSSYAETDSIHPISSSTYYYHVDDQNAEFKHLNNQVSTVNQQGIIDTTTTIGKDIELMMDMREQRSLTEGLNNQANVDLFLISIFPVILGSYIPMPQKEETRFQSIATTKVIQRFGILDSVVAIDKGSKISTDNLLYDSETGETLLTRTRNEFNDPVYNFTYPSHWEYSGTGCAYENINAVYTDIKIVNGVIQSNAKYPGMLNRFESGDEILASGKPEVSEDTTFNCNGQASCPTINFSNNYATIKLWAIDSRKIDSSSSPGIIFLDRYGNPYTADQCSLKIIRSGHRNLISNILGSITSLKTPIKKQGSLTKLIIDSTINIINSNAAVYNDKWKVKDAMYLKDTSTSQEYTTYLSPNVTIKGIHFNENTGGETNISNATFTGASYEWVGKSDSRHGCDGCHTKYIYNKSLLQFNFSSIPSTAIIQYADISFENKISSSDFCSTAYSDGDQDCHTHDYNSIGIYYYGNSAVSLKRITSSWDTYTSYNSIQTSDVNKVGVNFSSGDHTNVVCTDLIKNVYSDPISKIYGIEFVLDDESYDVDCDDEFNLLTFNSSSSSPSLFIRYTIPNNFTVCRSAITQRLINPYVVGILGNWRLDKSYIYYGQRKEIDPSIITDLKNNGTIKDFIPYWSFGTAYLTPTTDTSTYVWNAQSTQFNRKGFEIENKDPLGRYNSSTYGYNESLPVNVVQNSKYKDQFFDGFEDYKYSTQYCSQDCPVQRNIDFVKNQNLLDTSNVHTGKYSIKINPYDSVYLNFPILNSATLDSQKIALIGKSTPDTSVSPQGNGSLLASNPDNYSNITGYTGYIQSNVSGYYTITSTISHTNYSNAPQGYILGVTGVYNNTNNDNITNTLSVTAFLTAGQKSYISVYCKGGSYFTSSLVLQWQRLGSCGTTLTTIPSLNIYQSNQADNSVIYGSGPCSGVTGIKTDSSSLLPSFKPSQGQRMVFSAWVKEQRDCLCSSYDSNLVNVTFSRSGHADTIFTLKASGNIIEGWQQYNSTIDIPYDAISMRLALKSLSSAPVYFDDIRMFPYNANMKSFVYDPISLRLMAELDENNYATLYEYDDDGTLVRVKKETERGVQTIKETRSSLSKLNDQ